MKINNYFINQLHVLIQLHYYQDYPPRLSSKAQLSPSIFTLLSPILFCTFFMFISTYKSSGQCSGSLSGYNQNFTYTENALYGEICAGFTAVYLGGYNKVGIIEITYPHPVSYVQFEICSLSSGPVNSEHLEVWVDGALYDLNKASVVIKTNYLHITNPGNLGFSGISGVFEAFQGINGTSQVQITFPCAVNVLEVRNVHDSGTGGNGIFFSSRYCTTPSTLGSCKSLEQCSGTMSPNIPFNSPLVTNTVNTLDAPMACGKTTAMYTGQGILDGSVEITFPHPVSYFEFDFCALDGNISVTELYEIWVDGALYDLNKASVAFTNTQVFVTSPGNLGVSGISGVIEPNIEPNNPLINARNGSALITFPCGVKVLEVRHVHKIGHGNGSFILPRYCTTPSTLGSCLCTDRQLVISKTKIADCPTNILASVKVFNPGSDVLPSGTPITFYDGDPRLGGATRIITYTNTPAIPANAIQSISDIDIGVCDMNTVHLFAVLGDNGSHPLPLNLSTPLSGAGYDECDFTNNISGFKLRERCSQFGEIIKQ